VTDRKKARSITAQPDRDDDYEEDSALDVLRRDGEREQTRLPAVALARRARRCALVIVYAVIDDALSPDFPLGDSLEVFVHREDAERFIAEVRGDDPEMAAKLRIEERELGAGGLN
jgi:hypothetical protein